MKRLALGMILLAAPLLAQMPRGSFNWWDSPLTNTINLTEDQKKQIRDTLRDFRPKLIDLRASLEKAELETEDALNDETFDQKRASESVERLVAARGDMTRVMSQMSLKFRSILTAEQWKELQKKRREMGAPGMGMRPGTGPMPQDQRRMNRRQGVNPGGPAPAGPPPPGGPAPAGQAKPPEPEEE